MNNENLIDELYKIYCVGDSVGYNAVVSSKISAEELDSYINKNSSQIKNMFSSVKKDKKEDFIIDEVVETLNDLAIYVNDWLDSKLGGNHNYILPNDLLDFNLDTIDKAFKTYNIYTSKDVYNKTIDVLKFLKKNKSLEKVYGSNNWKNLTTKEILTSLKDFNKSFNIDENDISIKSNKTSVECFEYFNSIKNNCDRQFKNFNRYRPCLISKKQISAELDKLIFCKNMLEFLKTDLFVAPGGYLDCKVDCEEEYVLENLKKLYSKNFCLEDFKNKQANLIFNPNIGEQFEIEYNTPTKLAGIKSIKTNRGLIAGLVLKNEAEDIYYLIHIQILDLTNDAGNYEIQFNILPKGEFDNRIQLMRMDNYSRVQAHKNVGGQKLKTTTHVHLYNHFDLLRGKKNGNFDISHNVEEFGTDFDEALSMFVETLGLNNSLKSEILNKIKTIKNRKIKDLNSQLKETEV